MDLPESIVKVSVPGATPLESVKTSEAGIVFGTAAYMSPEQAVGARHIGAASDIYSLGCMVYEMLAGERPFTGPTSQAVLARLISGDARPLRSIRPEVPSHVDEALRRALAKRPEDRPPTSAAFLELLRG